MEETIAQRNELMDKTGEMQEILSRVPGRLVRYGTMVAVAVILSIISLTWFIPYPQYSEGSVAIVKDPDGKLSAVMQVGQQDIGKLQNGQPIMIALNSYPYQEYGYLKAAITHIADAADAADGQFQVHAAIPADSRTISNKQVGLKAGMTGSARILIREQKLIHRIIDFNKH